MLTPEAEAVLRVAVEEYEHYRLLHPEEDLPEPDGDAPDLVVAIAEHAVRSGAWESVTHMADEVILTSDQMEGELVLRAGEVALALPQGQRPLWIRNQGVDGSWTGPYTMSGETRSRPSGDSLRLVTRLPRAPAPPPGQD